MSQKERTGKRPSIYSAWHRRDSIKRFFAGDAIKASRLGMIDLDHVFVEAKHPYDRLPVALIEEAMVNYKLSPDSQHRKSAQIIYQLGKAANVPVFLVLYLPASYPNPAYQDIPDILEFYVKEWYPVKSEQWTCMTPENYAMFVFYLRKNHMRIKQNGKQLPLLPMADMGKLSTFSSDELILRWRFWFDNTEMTITNNNDGDSQ